ncbi:MAG: Ldh family oxidoreductase [Comamonadaceae bacterium]|nr:MAG: Ldh family oxidoreductase [Comamonadaceae bacterium]
MTEKTSGLASKPTTIPLAELQAFVTAAFVKAGLASADAATMTSSLVMADLRGTHSHGIIRLPFLVDRLLQGGAKRTPDIRVVNEAPATALLDGDQALGAITATRAMKLAVEKAKTQGIGMVTARNSDFLGTCAHYAMMGLPHDMIGICWTNGFPGMAPAGGRSNTIGNNPIAFAAPSLTHGPIVLDMALSVAAGGRIRVAAKNGEKIPADWLVDSEGRPTDDPNALTSGGALLPLGYKGYGLAVFGEILCGALTGSRMLSEIPAWFKDTSRDIGNGHIHIAIDISKFVEPRAFKERVDVMVGMLKATPLMPDVREILMPGERAWRTQQAQEKDGIPVPEPVAADLRRLAVSLGIDLPACLAAPLVAESAKTPAVAAQPA